MSQNKKVDQQKSHGNDEIIVAGVSIFHEEKPGGPKRNDGIVTIRGICNCTLLGECQRNIGLL